MANRGNCLCIEWSDLQSTSYDASIQDPVSIVKVKHGTFDTTIIFTVNLNDIDGRSYLQDVLHEAIFG